MIAQALRLFFAYGIYLSSALNYLHEIVLAQELFHTYLAVGCVYHGSAASCQTRLMISYGVSQYEPTYLGVTP